MSDKPTRSARVAKMVVMLAVWTGLAAAQTDTPSAAEQLHAFLKGTRALEAAFDQVVYDERSQPLDASHGRVAIKRPGRFVWDYFPPADRKIVSDGKHVWIHDIDIDQVTVQKLADTLGQSPAALLAGSTELAAEFEVTDAGNKGGLSWVAVTPKSGEKSFEALRLAFKWKELRRVEMVDALGQTTRIDFSEYRRNPDIDDERFEFIVPEGTDVIDQTGER